MEAKPEGIPITPMEKDVKYCMHVNPQGVTIEQPVKHAM